MTEHDPPRDQSQLDCRVELWHHVVLLRPCLVVKSVVMGRSKAAFLATYAVLFVCAVLTTVKSNNLPSKSFSECPSSSAIDCGRPSSCTEGGDCIYADSRCAESCKCQCTTDGRTPRSSKSTCPSDLTCSVQGCTSNGTCIFSSWACKERCRCACSLNGPPASCSHSCPNNLRCECIGCSSDGKCQFSDSTCQQACTCSCRQ